MRLSASSCARARDRSSCAAASTSALVAYRRPFETICVPRALPVPSVVPARAGHYRQSSISTISSSPRSWRNPLGLLGRSGFVDAADPPPAIRCARRRFARRGPNRRPGAPDRPRRMRAAGVAVRVPGGLPALFAPRAPAPGTAAPVTSPDTESASIALWTWAISRSSSAARSSRPRCPSIKSSRRRSIAAMRSAARSRSCASCWACSEMERRWALCREERSLGRCRQLPRILELFECGIGRGLRVR